jgi:formate dehydrogenase major subunit
MKTLRVNLDGKEVEAREGETILKLARRMGVEVPALCYDPRLPPYASCFVCIVEVEGRRGPAPACATKVEEKMVIRTRTENVVKLRRMALELLLSNHHGDCVAPCAMACPAGIDVRAYLAEAARGRYADALRVIKERNPLPSVCGRICPHKCEESCRRHLVDDPVGINQVKRFLADLDRQSTNPWKPKLAPRNGKRVAILGAGPAGLSAAYYLVQKGYSPVLFESMPKAGGMLRYGIPDYRLPQDVLDAEIRGITDLGVELRTGQSWGRDFHLDDLRAQGFSAIIAAVGAWSSQAMGVEGEDRPGIWSGIEMLEKANQGQAISLGDNVAVVGGGNTAMDCARTALRLGSKSVSIVYRRSRKEMPANPEEIHEAEEEGVRFHFLTAPVSFPGEGPVSFMRCVKMTLGEPDASGRRRPVPLAGSEADIPVDSVIAAIGQKVRWEKGFDADGLKLTRWGTPEADEATLRSVSHPDVFVCGDCFTGPATAVEAIGAGRKAALSAHAALSGEKTDLSTHPYNVSRGELKNLDKSEYAHHPKKRRTQITVLPAETRARTYDEVSKTLDERTAVEETGRCLLCGCQEVGVCLVRRYAAEYGATGERFPGEKSKPGPVVEHPYIVRDPQKCILCSRCVRVCSELQGVGAIGLVGRGFVTQVSPSWSESLQKVDCKSCGQCIATCPAGALSARLRDERVPSWRTEEREALCPYCGTGCRIPVEAADGKIQRVRHKMTDGPEAPSVCSRAFTGLDLLAAEKRLLSPMVKENGSWRNASMSEAVAAAAAGLRTAAEKGGPKSVAVLGSARLTNESHYLLQKIARAGIGTNHLGGLGVRGDLDALGRVFGANASTAAREDVSRSDLILAAGFDAEADFPAVASMIRQAVASGAGLQVFFHKASSLEKLAAQSLRADSPDLYRIFSSWARDLASSSGAPALEGLDALRKSPAGPEGLSAWVKPEKVRRMREAFLAASRPLLIASADSVQAAELACLADLCALKPGSGLLLLRGFSNAQGAIDQGLDGNWLPGQRPLSDPAARTEWSRVWQRPVPDWPGLGLSGIFRAASAGAISGLLSWGDNALIQSGLSGAFVASGEWLVPEKSHPASVVFPAASFTEDEGTMTTWDRRVQRPASPPWGGAGVRPNWRTLALLAEALGLPKPESLTALRVEMSRASRLYNGWDWAQWESGAQARTWEAQGGPARLLVPAEEASRESAAFFKFLGEGDFVEKFIQSRLESVRMEEARA